MCARPVITATKNNWKSTMKSWSAFAGGAAILVGSLAGCGGGGGGGGGVFAVAPTSQTSAPTASSPTGSDSTTQKTSVKVIDGAIRNALVFLDLNNNGELDAGEPSARTDAAGQATLDISLAD